MTEKTLLDIQQIRRLKADYCFYGDIKNGTCDHAGFAALFVDDAMLDFGFAQAEGREAIMAMMRDAAPLLADAVHTAFNARIDIRGDRASGTWTFANACVAVRGSPPEWFTGRSHEEYLHVGGTWYFKHVRFDISYLPPFLANLPV